MRLTVKPRQAFFRFHPRRREPSTPLASGRLLATSSPLPSSAFFRRRRSPLTPCCGRAAAAKECFPHPTRARSPRHRQLHLVGWRGFGPGATPGLPSIRVGPATVPGTFYRIRPRASGTPKQEPTRRTNGAFTGSPGGTTAALSDPASTTAATALPRQYLLLGSLLSLTAPPQRYTTTAAAALA